MPQRAARPLSGADSILFDQDDDQYLGLRVARVPLGNADGDGFIGEIENEDLATRLIVKARLDVTTAASSAADLDVGVTATSEESADNLLDGADVNTATGSFDNIDNAGTNGEPTVEWGPGEFVTISESSGDADDIAGELLVFYVDK